MAQDNPILQAASAGENSSNSSSEQQEGRQAEPGSMAANIASAALSASNKKLAETKKELAAGKTQLTGQSQAIVDSIGTMSESAQTIALAKDTADMQAQQTAADILEAAGGTEYQIKLMADLKSDGEQVANLLDERADIMDDEFTGFFPIDNIINEFRVKSTDAALNEARAQQTQTVTQIQNISAAQESFFVTNEHAKQTVNAGTIAANQRAIAADYAAQAAKQEIKNIESNAAMMTKLSTMDDKQASNLVKQYEIAASEEGRAIARKNLEIANKRLAAEDKAAETEDAYQAESVAAVQFMQQAMFGKSESADTISMLLKDPVTRSHYQSLRLRGSQAIIASGGDTANLGATVSFGDSAAETVTFLDTYDPDNNIKLTPVLKVVKDAKATAYAKLIEENGGTLPRDQAVIDAKINAVADSEMTKAAAEIKPRDYTNPYHAPPLATLEMSNSNMLQADAFYQKVLVPQQVNEIIPQDIVDKAKNAVLSKTITQAQMDEGLVKLFTAVANYNNTTRGGFGRVGLAKYNQTSFITEIERPASPYETLTSVGATAAQTLNPLNIMSYVTKGPEKTLEGIAEKAGSPATRAVLVNLMDITEVRHMSTLLLKAQQPEGDN